MTKPNSVITVIVILLAIIAVAVLGTGVFRKMQLDSSSREFAAEVVPLVLTRGVEALETYGHPDYLQQQPRESLIKYLYFVSLNQGELELVDSISGGSNVPLLIFSDQIPTASYALEVTFARGPATVEIELTYAGEAWQINAFEVVSEQMAD